MGCTQSIASADLHQAPVQNTAQVPHSFSMTGGFSDATLVLTKRGERPVHDLQPGDMIQTYEHGPQRLLAIGKRHFSAEYLLQNADLRPVRLEGFAYGTMARLDVLPQHRFLVRPGKGRSPLSRQSVMVRAGDVPGDWMKRPKITAQGVDYYHLVFDRHEVVLAGGIWCETVPLHARQDAFSDPHVSWHQDCDRALGRFSHKRRALRILSPREVNLLATHLKEKDALSPRRLPFIA